MNNDWKIFLISLSKILGIAGVFSILSFLLINKILVAIFVFIAVIAIQFAVNYFVNLVISKRNKDAEFLAAQVLKEAAERKLPYDLSCAYCNEYNRVGLTFSDENVFECTKCKKINKVYIQFTTTRITYPLSQIKGDRDIFDDTAEDTGVNQSTLNESIKLT